MSLNTLKLAEKVHAAGMPDEQAKALALAIDEELAKDIASKAELRDLVTKADLQKELEPIRHDVAVVKWMAGFLLVMQVAVLWRLIGSGAA